LRISGRSIILDGGIILVLGGLVLLLVFSALGPDSLYRDDAWQALAVRVETIGDALKSGVTAPGFSLLLRGWSALAGTSELVLQMPALVGGMLAPPLLYCLARFLGWTRAVAFLAGVLLAIAPVLGTYATRVKPFTLDALLTIVLFFLAWRLLDDPARGAGWAVLAGMAALAFLFSATAGLVGSAFLGVCGLLGWRGAQEARGAAFASLLIYAVIVGVWFLGFLGVSHNAALHEFWQAHFVPVDQGPVVAIKALARNIGAFLASLVMAPASLPKEIPAVLLACLVGPGAVLAVRRFRARSLLLLAPLGIAVVLAMAERVPLGGGRTDLYLAPLVVLLAVLPIETLVRRFGASHGRRFALGASAFLVAVAIPFGRAAYPVEDMQRLTVTLERHAAPEDAIVVYPQATYMVAYYGSGRVSIRPDELSMTGFTPELDNPPMTMLPGFEFTPKGPVYRQGEARSVELLSAVLTSRPPRVWIVASLLFDARLPVLDDRLEREGYRHTEDLNFPNAEAQLWVHEGDGRQAMIASGRGSVCVPTGLAES
jgi:hypothetical protein